MHFKVVFIYTDLPNGPIMAQWPTDTIRKLTWVLLTLSKKYVRQLALFLSLYHIRIGQNLSAKQGNCWMIFAAQFLFDEGLKKLLGIKVA